MNESRPRLLLLDGHSLAYRAFYALPVENFSTTTGQPTNAVFGFTSMLINALRDERPTHIAVAFDVSRKTFRSETFPEYKANRSKSPAEFAGQVDLIKTVLAAMDIVEVSVDGYEADDIIATLTKSARAQGVDVLIVTGDRDAFQLVDDGCTVLYPKRGVSEMARMDPEAVEQRYGLTPAQYPDFAALRGDPSDNLPSIPGVGEKTATKWINQFGSLDELVAHVDEVPGKAGGALRDHLSQVITNRQLTALVDDVPLPIDVDDLARAPFSREQVHEVFDSLQFRVLRERLFDTLGEDVEQQRAPATTTALADDPVAWLQQHAGPGPFGVHAVGTWGAGTGRIDRLAIAAEDGSAAVFESMSGEVGAWLGDPAVGKVLHDAKGPLLAARAMGVPVAGLIGDTALEAYLLLPGQRSFPLGDLTARFLHRDLVEPSTSDQLTMDGLEDTAAQELADSASAVLALHGELTTQLGPVGRALLDEMELPLEHVLVDMERAGIAVDLAHLHGLRDAFDSQIAEVTAEAHTLAGREFNLGSPKQLQEILFAERGLPKTKRIKTGYTTDAEALSTLYAKTQDPLLECLLIWRDKSKLRQTVAGLIPLVDSAGRIHTTYSQTVAATGRLSSTEPNLQNIPVRTAEGRQIRAAFVVGDGYESLLTADYSQIEMRLMAHLSQDEGLIEAFRTGEDLHNTVASKVFGVPVDSVDPEQRRRIKAMSYGLAYGLSAYGLSQQLGIGTDEAAGLMDEYFLRFGGIRDYLHEVVERARVDGYTQTLWGRRRYLPDLNSDNRQRREMAERMALNAPIQGSAADLVKVAMLEVNRSLSSAGLRTRMLLQVHDELVLEVGPGEQPEATAVVVAAMTGVKELRVPLEVSVGVGPDWDSAAH
ncbi:MAG: DNA polymerase I [Actinobacteria bacterium]|nr:DNA polymerase I [Actinomycetota bacterium]MCB8995951.1 DNA polymerase I [Actinomycetota bacterium]MCB9424158.1 DNA polymerase I [Actinomycetota bacterium]HRY08875.1 DNA polymerase I [Candidatus Nanopelagicales bacterium]